MLQVRRCIYSSVKRLLSTTSNNTVEHLKDRALIRVSGVEISDFLQGLITNDMGHLSSSQTSMYTMFLNPQGRVLYDTIIYRTPEKDSFLIECDEQVSEKLQKYLKMYRVRRKVDITGLSNEFDVYVAFQNDLKSAQPKINLPSSEKLLIYSDPRIAQLGTRILVRKDAKVNELVPSSSDANWNYRWLRYRLGVGEGIQDLPPGNCFPLECNCDYLHGVSFHKGCYVGQELTARVHHTGEVRKRLMPIVFTKTPSKTPEGNIVHNGVNLGKFRGLQFDSGLAMLRFAKLANLKEINIGDGVGSASKPNWWPLEASNEKISHKSQ